MKQNSAIFFLSLFRPPKQVIPTRMKRFAGNIRYFYGFDMKQEASKCETTKRIKLNRIAKTTVLLQPFEGEGEGNGRDTKN